MYIYAYNMGSKSARALADSLDATFIKREGSRFKGAAHKTVINWGCAELPPEVLKCKVINPARSVNLAHNKLTTFQSLKPNNISVPDFTTSQDMAQQWIERNRTVVARKTLTGHSGQGIEILEKGLDFVAAPLYTQYIPKDREYRVHVVNGAIVDVQRKVKDPNRDVKDWKVRSHDNGFIYIRNDEGGRSYKDLLEPAIANYAIQSVRALGLNFGAVDAIYNRKRNASFILEVNSAPGLENTTLQIYTNALRQLVG